MLEVFDDNNPFIKTSTVGSTARRLNFRHALFIEPAGGELSDASVLDIGCHNGRWMYVALRAGAHHVTGVDIDAEQIGVGREILAQYFSPERFHLEVGDMMEFLRQRTEPFDVILCLGILYHTIHQVEILYHCRRLAKRLVIVDSTICESKNHELLHEAVELPQGVKYIRRNMFVSATGKNPKSKNWETVPSRELLEAWFEALGFDFTKIEPAPGMTGQRDYDEEFRAAYYCRPRGGGSAPTTA